CFYGRPACAPELPIDTAKRVLNGAHAGNLLVCMGVLGPILESLRFVAQLWRQMPSIGATTHLRLDRSHDGRAPRETGGPGASCPVAPEPKGTTLITACFTKHPEILFRNLEAGED